MCMKCKLNDEVVVNKIEKIYNKNRYKYKMHIIGRMIGMVLIAAVIALFVFNAIKGSSDVHMFIAIMTLLLVSINTYLFLDIITTWTAYNQVPRYIDQYRSATDGVKTFILAYLIMSFNTVDFGSYIKILLDGDNIPEEFKELLRRVK